MQLVDLLYFSIFLFTPIAFSLHILGDLRIYFFHLFLVVGWVERSLTPYLIFIWHGFMWLSIKSVSSFTKVTPYVSIFALMSFDLEIDCNLPGKLEQLRH